MATTGQKSVSMHTYLFSRQWLVAANWLADNGSTALRSEQPIIRHSAAGDPDASLALPHPFQDDLHISIALETGKFLPPLNQ